MGLMKLVAREQCRTMNIKIGDCSFVPENELLSSSFPIVIHISASETDLG